MPAFLQLAGIPGEATDTGHNGWIRIDSMSSSTNRSIQQGAKDQQRARGETTLGDIMVNRQLDKSSTKLAEACATGKFFAQAQIDFCTTVKGKQQTFLSYVLKNVIVTSYNFHGVGSGDPIPSEQVTLGFSAIDWTYTVIDPNTGATAGQVPATYNPASGTGTV